jgi:hypothetical protein
MASIGTQTWRRVGWASIFIARSETTRGLRRAFQRQRAHLPSHQSQTATALGFTIPQFLLLHAEVIQ